MKWFYKLCIYASKRKWINMYHFVRIYSHPVGKPRVHFPPTNHPSLTCYTTLAKILALEPMGFKLLKVFWMTMSWSNFEKRCGPGCTLKLGTPVNLSSKTIRRLTNPFLSCSQSTVCCFSIGILGTTRSRGISGSTPKSSPCSKTFGKQTSFWRASMGLAYRFPVKSRDEVGRVIRNGFTQTSVIKGMVLNVHRDWSMCLTYERVMAPWEFFGEAKLFMQRRRNAFKSKARPIGACWRQSRSSFMWNVSTRTQTCAWKRLQGRWYSGTAGPFIRVWNRKDREKDPTSDVCRTSVWRRQPSQQRSSCWNE